MSYVTSNLKVIKISQNTFPTMSNPITIINYKYYEYFEGFIFSVLIGQGKLGPCLITL